MNNRFNILRFLVLLIAISVGVYPKINYGNPNVSSLKASNVATIDYGNSITVTGLVYTEYFYEQPNYGESPESDAISGACLIKIDSTNSVNLKDGKKLETFHLIFPENINIKCSSLEGHRIEVTGGIEERETGHHHGDALMNVERYKILSSDSNFTDQIKNIRSEFTLINRNLKSYDLIKKTVLGMSAEGAEMKVYTSNGELKKISVTYFGEIGKAYDDYYYQDNNLIFTLNKFIRYDKPFGKIVEKGENRYYFTSGEMIKWIDTKGESVVSKDGDFAKKEIEVVGTSKSLIDISKLSYKCVEVSSGTDYKPCNE
jgi:hypothetical protein